MTNAEHSKKRRDIARAAGKCLQCCKRPAIPGLVRCMDCYAKHVKRAPDDIAARQERRAKAVESGLCYTCCVRPVKIGCRYCEGCSSEASRQTRSVGWCDECLAFGFHRAECAARRRAA